MPKGSLEVKQMSNGLLKIIGQDRSYIGFKSRVPISKNQTYSTFVMILDSDYNRAIAKSNVELFFFTFILLLFVLLGCSYFSQRYLTPILQGLEQIENEHELIQREYDKARVEVERLAKKREADVDEEEYKRFLECLATLTRKEKEILNLYVKGYSSKDILETLNITDNTLKYHNRNIYSKLGVKSRKQLLMYMTLLNNKKELN